MTILHINYSDSQGGAFIAARRLVIAQRNNGIDAKLFVINKKTNYSFVYSASLFRRFFIAIYNKISVLFLKFFNGSTNKVLHSLNIFSCGLYKEINRIDCDIINLHWINNEMLSINDITKLNKPIVWTLHDSWAFCGAEHYQNGMDDDSYIKSYFPNPYKGININRFIYRKKIYFLGERKFIFIGPSRWETESLKKSLIFEKKYFYTIPNCLDLNIFKKMNKFELRDKFNLKRNKKYILYGAAGGFSNLKGSDLVLDILHEYIYKYEIKNVELLIFGSSKCNYFSSINLPIHYLGIIDDELTMSFIYNIADVILIPSRMDNLPQTATESSACGLPVVCFNVGGLIDIVSHKETGYIAKRFDIDDFAYGINWILNISNYESLSVKSVEKAVLNYKESICVSLYQNIYNKLIHN
jgi:glycosyltransferase involved in cell wall biosynthesis